MIRRLKIKFIVIASLAMLLALIVVLGVVNGVNYYNSKVEIFSVISRISGRPNERTSICVITGICRNVWNTDP